MECNSHEPHPLSGGVADRLPFVQRPADRITREPSKCKTAPRIFIAAALPLDPVLSSTKIQLRSKKFNYSAKR